MNMNLRKYEKGYAQKCAKCGKMIEENRERYWDTNSGNYYCLACGSLVTVDAGPSENNETEIDELVNIYKSIASKLKLADQDAMMRGAITIFLRRRDRHS